MEQTAMQDLRSDLNETLISANDALMEIKDETVRTACQEMVKITLKNIIKRIDDELLEMEKQQHSNTWDDSRIEDNGDNYLGKQLSFEEYYNETFQTQSTKQKWEQ